MIDLVEEYAGVRVHPSQPVEDVRVICDKLGVPYEDHWGSGKLLLEIAGSRAAGDDMRCTTCITPPS